MTKTNQDATLYVGKDYSVEFTEVDTDDLSAFTEITYAFADSKDADTNHFEKTKSGGGITVSGASNEVAAVAIDGSDTASLSTGTYYHELETEDGSGNEQVAATGMVTLEPSRTN